jgi:hypothetical protein
MSPVPPMMTSFMIDSPSELIRIKIADPLPIVMRKLPFGGQPVIEVMAIAPTAPLVEVVGEPRDLVA